MSPKTLARRLRKAQTLLYDGASPFEGYDFICHAIQLGLYKEAASEVFNTNEFLPEIALLKQLGMPIHTVGFHSVEFNFDNETRQGARFMFLELAALFAEDSQ